MNKNIAKQGVMCISLDTEFFWGVHDTTTYSSYGENVYYGHTKAIPLMLELFNEYGIHASWAVVGAVMAKDKKTLMNYLPPEDKRPSYDNPIRDSYRLLEELEDDVRKDQLFFGIDVVEKICNTKNQYIGSHTFSHYYCNESGQKKEQFDADIQSAVNIANSLGIKMTSIVFPKNEIQKDYVANCQKEGFEVYRGIEENWIYKMNHHSFLHRLLRFVDTYLPLSGSNAFKPEYKYGLLNIRGSRILRPYNVKLKFLEKVKINRIKGQMRQAAEKGLVFHLWWHPHNFGKNIEENMANLKTILDYYLELSKKYGFLSKSMEEIAVMYRGKSHADI